MNGFALFAAGIDAGLIKLIVIAVIVGLGAIAKLLAAMKQGQMQGGAPRPPEPAPGDPVVDEIEEFLRRAAQRRGTKGTRPIELERPAVAEVVEQPVRAEVVSEKPIGVEVTEHVKTYLDEKEFTRRTSQLGGEVVQADRESDQRLHQKFDHAVSQLAAKPGAAAVAPVAIEPPELVTHSPEMPGMSFAGLAILLTHPESICQAIVMNEILHRPEERW